MTDLSEDSKTPDFTDLLPAAEQDNTVPFAAPETASYAHALQEARQNLMQAHVYVFVAGSSSSWEKGQLLTLSAGSLVMDVVNSLRQEEGLDHEDTELQVWKNGKIALLNERVRNGDMLLVEHASSPSAILVS